MDMRRPDVLVVGLGPAGSRAAAAAARAGVSVLALDRRRRAGLPVQCAEFVPAMLDQELGGLARVTRQTIARMTTTVEDEDSDETPDFKGRMIDRAAFDRALAEDARAAGAACLWGESVAAITPEGAIATATGDCLRPRVVIGCDGTRSRIGRAIGAVNRAVVETRQVTVPACASDSSDVFLGADIVGGYGWLFPRDGEANLGVGVAAQARRSLKPLLERLHRALAARARVGARVLRQTGGAIPVGGRLRCHGRRAGTAVLLAGDAAGLANPITGAGIAAAVQSGDLAGSAAAAWLAGDDAALADYADELAWLFDASLARARQRRAELMADYRGGGRPSAAALRRAWIAYPEYWAAPAPQGVPS